MVLWKNFEGVKSKPWRGEQFPSIGLGQSKENLLGCSIWETEDRREPI